MPPGAIPLVAFVTAFDDYAVDAFELNAVAYLPLPDQPTPPGMASRRLKPTAHGHIATADRNALSPGLTTPVS